MSKELLKTSRLTIPGIIILLELLPFAFVIYPKLFSSSLAINTTIWTILGAILGAVYYLLDVRRIPTRRTHKKIIKNIHDQIKSFLSKYFSADEVSKLSGGETLMHIFYRVIDTDESLKEKSKSVMLNGLLYSTTADIAIISAAFSILYTIFIFIRDKSLYPLPVIFLIVAFVAYLLHLRATSKHIRLSNDQLDFMKYQKQEEIKACGEKSLKALS